MQVGCPYQTRASSDYYLNKSLHVLLHGSVPLEMDNGEQRGTCELTRGTQVSSLHCLFCWLLTVNVLIWNIAQVGKKKSTSSNQLFSLELQSNTFAPIQDWFIGLDWKNNWEMEQLDWCLCLFKLQNDPRFFDTLLGGFDWSLNWVGYLFLPLIGRMGLTGFNFRSTHYGSIQTIAGI